MVVALLKGKQTQTNFPFFGIDALGQLNMQIRGYEVGICEHVPAVLEQGATAGFRGHSENLGVS
jgi:hypothetical protein